MPHSVYILLSEKDEKRYIGCTSDLVERLQRHHTGKVKATRHRRPLRLVYAEEFESQAEAFAREQFFKSWAGRIELGRILGTRRSAPNAGKLIERTTERNKKS